MENNKLALKKKSLLDYIVMAMAVLGGFVAYYSPKLFEGPFLIVFLFLFLIIFLTRTVILIKQKKIGIHLFVFGAGFLVLLYLFINKIS